MRQFARALLAAGVTKGSSVALMLGQPPRVRDRRLRGRQHRRRRRAGEHVRPERRARLHPPPLRRVGSSSPRRRCSTTASSTSCSRATPSWREGAPGQLRSTAFPFLRRIVSLDPATQRDRRALGRPGRTRRRGVRRAPRRGDGRGAPARPRHHHLHLGHERQPQGRAARERHAGHPELALGQGAGPHARRQAAQQVPVLLVGGSHHDPGRPARRPAPPSSPSRASMPAPRSRSWSASG